jgi:hypothetical protein
LNEVLGRLSNHLISTQGNGKAKGCGMNFIFAAKRTKAPKNSFK